ncbi:MAG TPA: hypothetical protein VF401_02885 [Candidatus Saccharimonadales bacterium]
MTDAGEFSFARQINAVAQDGYALTDHEPQPIDRPPEAYLFTARSAIPVAAAVRGYYKELGNELPVRTSVSANAQKGWIHKTFTGPNTLSVSPATREAKKDMIDAFLVDEQKEIQRLSGLLSGMEHVCVIDQYVGTGSTITYAAYLAKQAGARTVSLIRGNWYEGWYPDKTRGESLELALENLYSTHEPFMHLIGVMSCRGVVHPTWRPVKLHASTN